MTIICNSRRFIFVHLHKCGGTSVRQAIRTQMRWNDLIIGGNENDNLLEAIYRRRYALEKHNSASQLHGIVGDEVWRDYWTFALVRHPASIMESFYYWSIKVLNALAGRKQLSFAETVSKIRAGQLEDDVLSWGAVNAYCKTDGFAEFVDYALQKNCLGFGKTLSERLTDADGRLVDDTFQLEHVAYFEQTFSERTGIPIKLGRHNRSQERESHWNEELLERIWQRYREDYQRFGYDKEPPITQ